MRTLIIIHSLKLGGMERVAVNLADAFAEEGHESHVLSCRSRPNDLKPNHPDVYLHHHDQLKSLLKSIIGIPVFLLSRLFLGVVLPKSHFIWVGWLNGWILKRKVRTLEKQYGRFDRVIFRGLGTFKYFWSFRDDRNIYVLENVIHYDRPLWQKKLEWQLVFNNRHLACVSSGVNASAVAAFEQGNIAPRSLRVITNPCPIKEIRALAEQVDPDIPDEPYIVNVGRLVPQKGHDLLLHAYALAKPRHKLVIVGEGSLRETLEQTTHELGIADRVFFAGKRRNPYNWMRQADLFVLSSEFEGLGIVLTEALACGTLIVSVDCSGGIRDVFKGDLEQYLSNTNPESLAELINKALAELPVTIKPTWLEDFDQKRIVELFLSTPPLIRV
ncbi:glycosyl transferase family 1 [Marinobacter psychrophilus]|jgi:glycosyltransferase involved in cell wall biosynthesis|uniref:Glycosyl transferase family 1 n=1 Tax=Marinobacter psychrophilus TaxID=330734 RepID=A0A0H4I189_9GAMM|nr:glycosyltransferase [Marinobacter psychrophilus]AKO51598.1 glycosyl transferase family 1 [Marinobacter psychrophilus]